MRTFLAHQRAAWTALALFAILGVLTSCTVTVSADPALLTRSGGWKFDSFTIGAAPNNQANLWTGMTVVFTGSGTSGAVTFTPTAAAIAAIPGAPAKFTGTWSLNDTRTQITLSNTNLVDGPLFMTELSATTLRIKTSIEQKDVEWKFTGN